MSNTHTSTGVVIQMPISIQSMQNSIADELLYHRESLRHGQLIPKRSCIDPRTLKKSLNYTFISEQHPTGDLRFRQAGSKVCDFMGMELRGMPIQALIDLKDRNQFRSALQRMQETPEILDIRLTEGARLILLPLTDEENVINRVLGCLIANPDLRVFPACMGILSISGKRIVNAPTPKALEIAEAQTPFLTRIKKATQSGPPILKLIQ